jgi:ABC-type polysaccharide/polyol phosphate export permease
MDVCNETTVAPPETFPAPPSPRRAPSWLDRIRTDFAELTRFWPVVQNMVTQELHVRYQRSFMGFLWTLINPLLMMMTLSIVFSSLLHMEDEMYSLYLLAGMVPWTFMSGSITEATGCILSNEGLIRKIYIPKLVFPLVRVLINLVTATLSMGALFLLLLPLGARPSLPMLMLPLAMALYCAFTLGVCLLVATTNTFFRDCAHLVSVFMQAWYFATPIIYRLETFPESVQWRFRLNPAYYFIRMFHDAICDGLWPRLGTVAIAAALATVSLGVGYAAFKSNEDKMVFRL